MREAKIEITSPEQMQAFLAQEEKMLKEMVVVAYTLAYVYVYESRIVS